MDLGVGDHVAILDGGDSSASELVRFTKESEADIIYTFTTGPKGFIYMESKSPMPGRGFQFAIHQGMH